MDLLSIPIAQVVETYVDHPTDPTQRSLHFDLSRAIQMYNFTGCPDEDWTDVCSIAQACVQNSRGWIWRIPSHPVIRDNPIFLNDLPHGGGVYAKAVGVAHNGVPIYSPYDASGEDALFKQQYLMGHCGGCALPPALMSSSEALSRDFRHSEREICSENCPCRRSSIQTALVRRLDEVASFACPFSIHGTRLFLPCDVGSMHDEDCSIGMVNAAEALPLTCGCNVDMGGWNMAG